MINCCLQAVNEFQSLVSQVQKSSSMVEKVVYSIMTSNLVRDPAMHGSQDVMDLQELYDHLERFRLEVRSPACIYSTCAIGSSAGSFNCHQQTLQSRQFLMDGCLLLSYGVVLTDLQVSFLDSVHSVVLD